MGRLELPNPPTKPRLSGTIAALISKLLLDISIRLLIQLNWRELEIEVLNCKLRDCQKRVNLTGRLMSPFGRVMSPFGRLMSPLHFCEKLKTYDVGPEIYLWVL